VETDKTKVPKTSFLTDLWSLDLIGDPQNPAEKSIPGIHPQWEKVYDTFQFVDPSTNESIAYWDYRQGIPYFYKYGYLRVHPKIKGKFAWAWSPMEDPFAAEKGRYDLSMFLHCRPSMRFWEIDIVLADRYPYERYVIILGTVPLGDWLEKKGTAIIIKQQFGFLIRTT
jgi:hypothetical protein